MKNQSKIIDYWATLEAGSVYHIYNHAIGNDNLFREHENYMFFIKKWKQYWACYMDVFAYCLMPNHFHVLGKLKPLTEDIRMEIKKEGTAKALAYLEGKVPENVFYESQFKRFFTSYSKAYGKKYNRVGSLFRAKFKRTLISDKEQLLDMMFYIHHNPIHHGFCTHFGQWAYCSYNDFMEEKEGFLFFPVLKYFGNTMEEALPHFEREHERYRLNFKSEL